METEDITYIQEIEENYESFLYKLYDIGGEDSIGYKSQLEIIAKFFADNPNCNKDTTWGNGNLERQQQLLSNLFFELGISALSTGYSEVLVEKIFSSQEFFRTFQISSYHLRQAANKATERFEPIFERTTVQVPNATIAYNYVAKASTYLLSVKQTTQIPVF